MSGIVQVTDTITGEVSFIDLRDDSEREPRTAADILAQELDADTPPWDYDEIEIVEGEIEEPGEEEQSTDHVVEQVGVKFVAICIDSAMVTHDMDFTEDDDIRQAVRDWTNDQPNRISLIWQRLSREHEWELVETITSTTRQTSAHVVE